MSDSIRSKIQSRYTVAFIIEADGHITGERVVNDSGNGVGQNVLKAVRSCHWYPATCGGKKVAMLYALTVNLDFSKE